MEAKAYLRYIRISPRKMKPVLDLIRGKDVGKAEAILTYTQRGATESLQKLLKSAKANAENNFNMDANNLYVAQCFATEGPTLKRMRARAKGRGARIEKRTSHITLVLKERAEN